MSTLLGPCEVEGLVRVRVRVRGRVRVRVRVRVRIRLTFVVTTRSYPWCVEHQGAAPNLCAWCVEHRFVAPNHHLS